jgi:RecA DNA recombination protein
MEVERHSPLVKKRKLSESGSVLVSTSHQAAAVVRPVEERLAALALPGRVRVGSTVAEPVPRLTCGLPSVDALLDGGVPQGRISEVCGPRSSGKTSWLLTLLAAVTRRGEMTACVDLADALHPESVRGAGADLHRLLWVRPRSVTDALRCTDLLLQAGGFAVVVLDLGPGARTPEASTLRRAPEDGSGGRAGVHSAGPSAEGFGPQAGPLPSLDDARDRDGSLRGARSDKRIGAPRLRPLRAHVWPRLLHAAERSHSALVVLAGQRVAGSFATLSLALRPRTPLWRRGAWPLFDGFETTMQVERNKLGAPGRHTALVVGTKRMENREWRTGNGEPVNAEKSRAEDSAIPGSPFSIPGSRFSILPHERPARR